MSGDLCKGDSGGPLLWSTIVDGQPKFLQLGVVSEAYSTTGPDAGCEDRNANPEVGEGDDPDDSVTTWTFLPYQSDWMCSVSGICDADVDVDTGEEEENENENEK